MNITTNPDNLTQVIPIFIQSSTTTTANGVATSIVVLGEDNNLYFTQINVPTLNPTNVAIQPWTVLPPIEYNTEDGVGYPFPADIGGNVVAAPYKTFKIQGAS